MQIPDYRIKALCSWLKHIIIHATYDVRNTRTANALRLIKQDLAYLDKVMNQKTKNEKR